MDLLVSCTLEGRDLAIVKSIININNIFGDLNLTYVNDVESSQVLFAKRSIEGNDVYFAEDRVSGKKYKIKPSLNPKTVRAMFEFLGNSMRVSSLEKNTQATEIINIHQFILQNSNSESGKAMLIDHESFALIIDQKQQQVLSTVELNNDLLKSIASNNISNIQFNFIEPPFDKSFKFEMNLSAFKWDLGYFYENQLIANEHKENKRFFKLLHWPNFGAFKFDQEFIRLCSLLRNQPKNYNHLVDVTGYQENTINKFLNATMMAGLINVEKNEHAINEVDHKKENHFIYSVKKFFGFI